MRKKKEKVKKSLGRNIVEWILTIVIAVVAAFAIRSFVFELVKVDGTSMLNTLKDGEIMIVSKFDYSSTWLNLPFNIQTDNSEQEAARIVFGTPKRLDVVICRYPARGDTDFVKRIVGIPGDTIKLEEGYLWVKAAGEEDFTQVAAESEIAGITNEYRGRDEDGSQNTATKDASGNYVNNSIAYSFGPYYVPKKGDKLILQSNTAGTQLKYFVDGKAWGRGHTTLIAKDGSGKTLKIYELKANDGSRTGQSETTKTVVQYDGKKYTLKEFIAACPGLFDTELTIDEDYYFVMGDHRNGSNDSRSVGAIERSAIVGHVRTIFFGDWRGIQ